MKLAPFKFHMLLIPAPSPKGWGCSWLAGWVRAEGRGGRPGEAPECEAAALAGGQGPSITIAQLKPPQGPASPWQPQTACSFQRRRWQQSEPGPVEWCPHDKGRGVWKCCMIDSRCLLGMLLGGEAHPSRAREGLGEAWESGVQTRKLG